MKKKEENMSIIKEIYSFILMLMGVLTFVIPFKYFIAEPFIVDGRSMSPNFESGHYIIINKLYDTFSNIQRGDILVFIPPLERSDDWRKYTVFFDPRKKYIKRIIALPGETIRLEDHKIFIKKIGEKDFKKLDEPYIKNNGTTKEIETVLKKDEYFMLGDNRAKSHDSEEWGAIKKSDIIGVPLLRILPFSQFETNPAIYSFKK